MAETVAPSVRGRQRVLVELALLVGAVGSAVPVGFIIGVAGSGLPDRLAGHVVAVVALGVALDACHLVTGRFHPPAIGRQVPREWGRLLPPPVTGLLYGARLGVGPLTILSTWLWWSALLAAALIGVWPAVAVSVWFATWRIVINSVIGWGLRRRSRSNLAAVGSLRRRSWTGLTVLAGAMTVAAALSACGPADDAAVGVAEKPTRGISGRSSGQFAAPSTPAVPPRSNPTVPPPTAPARLEDFVPTPSTSTSSSATTAAPNPASDAPAKQEGPGGLAALAPVALEGMTVIDDPSVDRFLTIDEAAAIQPDPTEELALLETRGYRGGWIRAFRSDDSTVAVASVYEFADPVEAEFYLEDGLITIGGYGGRFFDIADLPGVRGFQQDVMDEGEQTRTLGAAFHRHNRWYLLYMVGSPQAVTADVLLPALRSWHGGSVRPEHS